MFYHALLWYNKTQSRFGVGNVYLIVSACLYLGIILAAFLFVRRQFPKDSPLYAIIITVFVLTFVSIFIDTTARMISDGKLNLPVWVSIFASTWNFIMMPTIIASWLLYICNSVLPDRVPRRNYIVFGSLLIVNFILTLVSLIPGTNIYFTYVNGVYARGAFYWFHALIFLFYFVMDIYILARFSKLVLFNQRVIFFLIFLLPVVGFIGQIIYAKVPFLLISFVFSFMILAMSVQYVNASTDFLTGVPNRQRLSIFLHRKMVTLSHDGAFAVIMLDLDNFKTINDTLGHTVGDDALRLVARYLKYHCPGNEFVARFGGDEFIVIVDKSNSEELDLHIEQMRSGLESFANDDFHPYKITFSSGYFIYQKKANLSITELFTIIDDRMFENKRQRTNQKI